MVCCKSPFSREHFILRYSHVRSFCHTKYCNYACYMCLHIKLVTNVLRTIVGPLTSALLASFSSSYDRDENFNLGHNLTTMRYMTFIFQMFIPCDLSHHTLIFYQMTLTLKFNLLIKNLNLGHKILLFRFGCLSGVGWVILRISVPLTIFQSYHDFEVRDT